MSEFPPDLVITIKNVRGQYLATAVASDGSIPENETLALGTLRRMKIGLSEAIQEFYEPFEPERLPRQPKLEKAPANSGASQE